MKGKYLVVVTVGPGNETFSFWTNSGPAMLKKLKALDMLRKSRMVYLYGRTAVGRLCL